MSNIVEEVAKVYSPITFRHEEVARDFLASAGRSWEGSHEEKIHRAKKEELFSKTRDAIKATIEHLRNNVSEAMSKAGGKKLRDIYWPGDEDECFRAMLNAALSALLPETTQGEG